MKLIVDAPGPHPRSRSTARAAISPSAWGAVIWFASQVEARSENFGQRCRASSRGVLERLEGENRAAFSSEIRSDRPGTAGRSVCHRAKRVESSRSSNRGNRRRRQAPHRSPMNGSPGARCSIARAAEGVPPMTPFDRSLDTEQPRHRFGWSTMNATRGRAAWRAVRRKRMSASVALRLERKPRCTAAEEHARAVIESAGEPGLSGFGCPCVAKNRSSSTACSTRPGDEAASAAPENVSGDVGSLSGILEAIERPDARAAFAQRREMDRYPSRQPTRLLRR